MKKAIIGMGIAAVLWFYMFFPYIGHSVSFWTLMTVAAVILTTYALQNHGRQLLGAAKPTMADVAIGLGIAVALWAVFWIGDKVSQCILPFARPQVDLIYGMKEGSSPLAVSLLLLLIIGPAEELFWRGYAQRTLQQHLGANTGFFLATLVYTAIHAASLNFMLLGAAMVAGVAWGLLYRLFPQRLPALIISHALWDAAVFIWFPIM